MLSEDEIKEINKNLDGMDLPELELRLKMAQAALKLVIIEGDPNEVLPIYKAQVQRINAAIRKKKVAARNGGDPPPKQVVGLKTGSFTAKVQKDGRIQ